MSEQQQYYNPADYTTVHNTHLKRLQVAGTELERLRRIEQAAREVVMTISAEPFDEDESARAHQALRSALESV